MKNQNEKMFFLEVESEDQEKITKQFPGAQIFEANLSETEIIKNCQDAEILCVFIYSQITKKVIENLPHLKFIITRSVGYNHIDLQAAAKKNISVCNVPDYGCYVIAEHVFAILLSGLRNVAAAENRVEKEHNFDFHGLRGISLKNKTLGIIGTGKIGKNVARIAKCGFLMNVLANDLYPDLEFSKKIGFQYCNLEKIFTESDIISLHCPLLESTKHLINSKTINKMKKGVSIVNTSRGGVISTPDLIVAIKSGKVSHAALDVLEHEKNLEEYQELFSLPEVLITPHIAFYADESMQKMYNESFNSIGRFLKKEKLQHEVFGI